MRILLPIPLLFLNTARMLLMLTCFIVYASGLYAQGNDQGLHKVMTLTGEKPGSSDLPEDHGLNGIWQKLLKLQTTASVMHTQAHPDDEHADLLTYLARGKGVRTALLSLNRGESGGNIAGSEFFDQLALLRTEEFLLASAYYGLDDLYFTNLVDYGFSKRVEEAYEKWGRENVIREMVRVIRINRPLVIISRFHGSKRDGHGNHQAAGEISQEAYKLAADATAFPEQLIKEGLRPWKALKLYRGGVRASERWNIALNSGEYCPWIGDTYKNFSLLGYSFHRSQHGGYRNYVNGFFNQYYERLHSHVNAGEKEKNFFEGIDTSLTGIFQITGETPPAGVMPLLHSIRKAITDAISTFQARDPLIMIPYLVKGMRDTREAIKLMKDRPDGLFMLQVKEQQFMDAIHSIMGIHIQARALPQGSKEATGFYQAQPTMGFAVPGQRLKVAVNVINRSNIPMLPVTIKLLRDTNWQAYAQEARTSAFDNYESVEQYFDVTVPADAVFSQPYYHRKSIQDNHYGYDDQRQQNLPNRKPALQALVTYRVQNENVQILRPVEVKQPNLPFGLETFAFKVAPAIAVNIHPKMGIIPTEGEVKHRDIQVELINNLDSAMTGDLRLKLPAGWKAETPVIPFKFTKAGERINVSFGIETAKLEEKNYEIEAIATVNGRAYTQGYELSRHRDLDQTLLYRRAITEVKGINVKMTPGLKIGYIMGVGDEVPDAIRQLGAAVQLLTGEHLSKTALGGFDAIMIGTRAYAVRQDLIAYNQRLLEYAKNGGHLIVLFQTPEFNPQLMAPYTATLPANPEEVSEENSPLKILQQNHPVLNYPNKITSADFNDWVEQRGSKFLSAWDSSYKPIISTQDAGQSPQSGGWLMTKYGKGHYTYFAYSFHRQLPYGVTGAYRIMANLLSYGKKLLVTK